MIVRDPQRMTDRQYDLVVVGGGIFGICLTWEAASRGLSVALLEQGDFCQGTSANSFKLVHGGMRYLQHGDLYRVRESCAERSSLMRIAPHLVRPLPIVVPTYGGLLRGKTILRTALGIYDMLTWDRNRGLPDGLNHVPCGRMLSRNETLATFPELDANGLTGAAVFHDGQMYNPTRLAVSFLRSATAAGADAANHVEVTGFLKQGDRVCGVKARDRLEDQPIEIRAGMVINAAGGWSGSLLAELGVQMEPRPTFSRDACFVVPRRLVPGPHALAIPGQTKDPDALLSRGARHLFLAPWRDYTLIGVWHQVYAGKPGEFTVTPKELQAFVDEVQAALPALGLTLDDISLWNAGLVLFGQNADGAEDLSYGKRSWIIDHASDGVEGLMTVIGVRYTTARGIAQRALDLIAGRLKRPLAPSTTSHTPIHGGDFESFDGLLREATSSANGPLSSRLAVALLRNYGSRYGDVLRYAADEPSLAEPLGDSTTLRAEIVHAVREESARTLGDAVFSRTDVATAVYPGDESLYDCARLLARELSWNDERIEREVETVRGRFFKL